MNSKGDTHEEGQEAEQAEREREDHNPETCSVCRVLKYGEIPGSADLAVFTCKYGEGVHPVPEGANPDQEGAAVQWLPTEGPHHPAQEEQRDVAPPPEAGQGGAQAGLRGQADQVGVSVQGAADAGQAEAARIDYEGQVARLAAGLEEARRVYRNAEAVMVEHLARYEREIDELRTKLRMTEEAANEIRKKNEQLLTGNQELLAKLREKESEAVKPVVSPSYDEG